MAFHETPRFPDDISYGSIAAPMYNTAIIETDSGHEERIQRLSSPRRSYDVSYGVKSDADAATLIDFFTARGGAANGFRFWDPFDYTTAVNHTATPSDTDIVLGVGNGTITQFQLKTQYVSGAQTIERNITKPTTGSTVVSIDDVPQVSGFTVDTTTGIITFSTAPASAEVIKAGCRFDVPVRFEASTDAGMMMSIISFDNIHALNIKVIELVNEIGPEEAFDYGGAQELSISADVVLDLSGRMVVIAATAAGLNMDLPDPTNRQPGPDQVAIFVEGANSIQLRDDQSVNIVSIASGSGVRISLSKDTGGNKVWYSK